MSYTIDDFKNELKTVVNSLKEKFNMTEQKFLDAKLQDGTIIRIDGEQIIPNAKVSAIDEAGNLIPLVDGNYVFEDGSMLEVKQGVVVMYEPKAQGEETPAATEQKPNEEMSEPTNTNTPMPKSVIESIVKESRFEIEKAVDEKFAAINETLKTLSEKFEAVQKENETLKTENEKQQEIVKEIFSVVDKIANEPKTEPLFQKRDGFSLITDREKEIEDFRKKSAKMLGY